WLCIEAKNRFAQSGELSLLAISISKLAPATSTTPTPSSRPPTPMLKVTPTAMEVGLSKERHDKGSRVVVLAARAQDEDVEMTGLGADAENKGVVPGVKGRAVALDTDSGTTDADQGPARNMCAMAESAAMESEDLLLAPCPRPHPQLPLMGTPWMLPSSWQELMRADARAKAAGDALASGSRSKHQPQTLVGVVIDQKHAATHEIGKTGVGLAANKHHQMNAFGVDRKSTGEVEVKVVSPATKAKGRACQLMVATCKALSNMVMEDSELDGGAEIVLGPSKVVNMVDPAAFSFPAPNREKFAMAQCMYWNTLRAASALSHRAANAHGDLWALKALYTPLWLWEKEALTHVSKMEVVLGRFADLVESERDEGTSRRGSLLAAVRKGKAWAETEELSEEEEMASRDEEYDTELEE
ncbi:hypothetical protein DXG03_006817, partial [Asterophora parasitica]